MSEWVRTFENGADYSESLEGPSEAQMLGNFMRNLIR